jgi:hypothetical protein
MTEPQYSFFVFSDEQLASTVSGASGAKRIGVSAITGISAQDVQAVLAELAARSGASAASETAAGIAEIATQSEVDAGTDNERIVTPLKLAGRTATETRTGLVELASATETSTGTDNTRAVHPAGLKSTLDSRPSPIGSFLAGDGPTVLSGVTVPANGSQVSTDLRGAGGVPSDARGIFALVHADVQSSGRYLYIDSADAPILAANSPRMRCLTSIAEGHYAIPLGSSAGANAGKIKLSAETAAAVSGVSLWITGWWK